MGSSQRCSTLQVGTLFRLNLCQTCCCPAWVFFLLVADCKSCQRRPTPGDGLRQQQVLRQVLPHLSPLLALLSLASRLLQISHAPADAFPVLVEHGLEPRNGLPVFTRCTGAALWCHPLLGVWFVALQHRPLSHKLVADFVIVKQGWLCRQASWMQNAWFQLVGARASSPCRPQPNASTPIGVQAQRPAAAAAYQHSLAKQQLNHRAHVRLDKGNIAP
mmetsp:Transcript_3526/g.9820  ORF Transcript_3526/g.9820 Transcript_3526/m.9820 type:complete len:218 (-) Transcript_3526:692-1345(-)